LQGDKVRWVAWGNAFAEEQARYAASAVAPILTTIAAVNGFEMDVEAKAKAIGDRYANALKQHFSRLGAGADEQGPELTTLFIDIGDNKQGE
jgi:hypothetical protein